MSKFVDPKYFAFHEDRAAKCDVFLDAHTFAWRGRMVRSPAKSFAPVRAMTHAIGSEFTPYVDLDIGLVLFYTCADQVRRGGEEKEMKKKKKKIEAHGSG